MTRKVNLTLDIPNTVLYFISTIDLMVMFNFNQTNSRAYGLSKSTTLEELNKPKNSKYFLN